MIHNRWFEAQFFLRLFLCAEITIVSSAINVNNSSLNHEIILAARCRVRCLSQLQITLEFPMFTSRRTESYSLMNCLQDTPCTDCLKPCNQAMLNHNQCHDVCRLPAEGQACTASCRFLRQIESIHPGQCPHGNSYQGNDSVSSSSECGRMCSNDSACHTNEKCCSSPRCANSTCHPAIDYLYGLPEVPEVPSLHERSRGAGIELRWHPVAVNISGPVLYLIDSQFSIGPHFNERGLTSWQQVTQTTGSSAIISDVTPGHWYLFRISAVNIHGSRRPSDATRPFTLTKEPRRPGPPTNLTESDTLIVGTMMSVIVQWFPPRKSDLPVTRYKVTWYKGTHQSSSKKMRQVLSGHRLSFQIPNLESDTTYLVQVQAICQYGDIRLKSEKASVYVTTFPLPRNRGNHDDYSDEIIGRSLPTPAPVDSLTVQKPFYEDGAVKVNVSWTFLNDDIEMTVKQFIVYWSPEACIVDGSLRAPARAQSFPTNKTWFILHDLRFDCRYIVRVDAVSVGGMTTPGKRISFTMPSCSDFQSINKLRSVCSAANPIPSEPANFTHSFLISGSNISSRLSWSHPVNEDGAPSVSGYRLVWGLLLPGQHTSSTAIDKATFHTKSLPKNSVGLSIGSLREGATYVVELQAFSGTIAGRTASIQFTTPLLRVLPVDFPNRDSSPSSASSASSSLSVSKYEQPMKWKNDSARMLTPGSRVAVVGVATSISIWKDISDHGSFVSSTAPLTMFMAPLFVIVNPLCMRCLYNNFVHVF